MLKGYMITEKLGTPAIWQSNLTRLQCHWKYSFFEVEKENILECLNATLQSTVTVQGVSQLLKQSDWAQMQDFKWYHNDDYIYWKVKR